MEAVAAAAALLVHGNFMLDIILLSIGKIRDRNYSDLAKEYIKRIKPYARLKVIELEAVSFSEKTKEKAKEFENERIENFLEKQKEDRLIYLLSENGKEYNSIAFASFLRDKKPLLLVLGGSLGFTSTMKEKYPSLSLSLLTFPHELARVIVLEQIYRAASILQNKNYHY